MGKRVILNLMFLLLLNITSINAQENLKEHTISRTQTAPKIDGILDDPCWDHCLSINSFKQQFPNFNAEPSQKSEIKITYDNYSIYIAAYLFDHSPDSILAQLGSRDDHDIVSDMFYIGFDTYKRLDAYVFGVSASGVQFDYRDSDFTYDAVWQSATKITDSGWVVEMRIPYSAIRFPSTEIQEWGFQVVREIKRNNETIQWALVPKHVTSSRSLWGTIKGMNNIKPPVRLSISPFVNLFYQSVPMTHSDQTVSYSGAFSYNFGADLKYGIDEKYTIDVTLMPDFSQVQSDNKVKTLGYDEVVFNENRPFFKEGTELFNKNQLFYSRRIGKTPEKHNSIGSELQEGETLLENPSTVKLINAIKLTGRNNNGLGIGLFNGITDNMYAVIEDSLGEKRKVQTEPLANYNVIVFDQKLKNNSNIYFINTNVIRPNQHKTANVTGTGFVFMDKKSVWAIDGNYAISQKYSSIDSIENNFNTIVGHRYFGGFRKASGNFQFGLSHTYIGKTYDSRDMGYYVIGNKQTEKVYVSYDTYKPNKIFRESYHSASFTYSTNPETLKSIGNSLNINSTFLLKNYAYLNLNIYGMLFKAFDYYEPRVTGKIFRKYKNYNLSASYSSDERKPFSYGIDISFGDFSEVYDGPAYGITPSIKYRLKNNFQFDYSFRYFDNTYNIGFVDIVSHDEIIFGGRRLVTTENNFSIQYVIKNDMSLSLVGRHYWYTGEYLQYYTLQSDGGIEINNRYQRDKNFSYNVFFVDFVYSWQFAPGSTLSVVYKNAIESDKALTETNYFRNLEETFNMPKSHSISIKFLYYLDYLNVRKGLRAKG